MAQKTEKLMLNDLVQSHFWQVQPKCSDPNGSKWIAVKTNHKHVNDMNIAIFTGAGDFMAWYTEDEARNVFNYDSDNPVEYDTAIKLFSKSYSDWFDSYLTNFVTAVQKQYSSHKFEIESTKQKHLLRLLKQNKSGSEPYVFIEKVSGYIYKPITFDLPDITSISNIFEDDPLRKLVLAWA